MITGGAGIWYFGPTWQPESKTEAPIDPAAQMSVHCFIRSFIDIDVSIAYEALSVATAGTALRDPPIRVRSRSKARYMTGVV